MTLLSLPRSPVANARLAGLCYLTIIVCGLFAQMVVRSSLIAWDDPALTAQNIRADEALFRMGLVADLIVLVMDVALAALFFRLLAPVHSGWALLAMVLRVMMTAILAFNAVHMFLPLYLLGDGNLGQLFPTDQANALSVLSLALHNAGNHLALLMFGLYSLILGALIIRAPYFPAFLGGLVCLSGLSYVALGLIHFALPQLNGFGMALLLCAALPEFMLTGWLLLRGLNKMAWDQHLNSD